MGLEVTTVDLEDSHSTEARVLDGSNLLDVETQWQSRSCRSQTALGTVIEQCGREGKGLGPDLLTFDATQCNAARQLAALHCVKWREQKCAIFTQI